MIIDSHTHTYLPEFDADRAAMMQRVADAGVVHMVLPGVDAGTWQRQLDMAALYPERVTLAMGLHPTELGDDPEQRLADVLDILDNNGGRLKAVGEIGIDLYWDATRADLQQQFFDRQLRRALALDLPVIIHCRRALDPVLEVLKGLPAVPQGVFHSFDGTPADVERILAVADFHFGINGVVTFKNATLKHTLPAIPLERLLVETDAPWLSPTPLRGRRNEPSHLPHTVQYISDYLGVPRTDIEQHTTANACRLFDIKV